MLHIDKTLHKLNSFKIPLGFVGKEIVQVLTCTWDSEDPKLISYNPGYSLLFLGQPMGDYGVHNERAAPSLISRRPRPTPHVALMPQNTSGNFSVEALHPKLSSDMFRQSKLSFAELLCLTFFRLSPCPPKGHKTNSPLAPQTL